MLMRRTQTAIDLSLSARRAWIEIPAGINSGNCLVVALRKESVDRNTLFLLFPVGFGCVALRKESVDRNCADLRLVPPLNVALRKESVDRNPVLAWRLTACLMVALRKESVDRNPFGCSLS